MISDIGPQRTGQGKVPATESDDLLSATGAGLACPRWPGPISIQFGQPAQRRGGELTSLPGSRRLPVFNSTGGVRMTLSKSATAEKTADDLRVNVQMIREY